jgi:hypothetical protein
MLAECKHFPRLPSRNALGVGVVLMEFSYSLTSRSAVYGVVTPRLDFDLRTDWSVEGDERCGGGGRGAQEARMRFVGQSVAQRVFKAKNRGTCPATIAQCVCDA